MTIHHKNHHYLNYDYNDQVYIKGEAVATFVAGYVATISYNKEWWCRTNRICC